MSLFPSKYVPQPVLVGRDMYNRTIYRCPFTSIRVDCMSCIFVNKQAVEEHIRHTHFTVNNQNIFTPAKLYRCSEPTCHAVCPNALGYRSHVAYWHPERCAIEGCPVKVHLVPNHAHELEGARLRARVTRLKAAYKEDYITAMLQVDSEVFFAPQPLDYGVDVSRIFRVNV